MSSYHTNHQLKRLQGPVLRADYERVIRLLGGNDWGLQSEIVFCLFSAFTKYLATLNFKPHAHDRTTPDRIRAILPHLTVAVGNISAVSKSPDEPGSRAVDGSGAEPNR